MNADREKQVAEAEEMLGDRIDRISFAKGLFFGRYSDDSLAPYPSVARDPQVRELTERVSMFCETEIDAAAIDRQAELPPKVVQGLGNLGVLGACLPKSCGGLGLSQAAYCQILEVLGGHCGSTALFVNAHHSIGPRALVLFGTAEQQQRWLPKLASGEWISAFALTEPEAGSDAANVQTTATPTPDGKGYRLNGEKRWITNGGIANVLTVMARTPVSNAAKSNNQETKITAFLVTPDMPGFQVVEKRMEKCGVRGTATSRLAFHDMFVPSENILGQLGKGLKVALTVLDFGRTTFGASCTGAAKFCIGRSIQHANSRVQFQQKIGSFEMVKEKLAYMQAGAFAMEACTYVTASLIDQDVSDFMLETAMLKVFSTEVLWRIVNDTFQIHGGKAYFTDEPFERMMRDARINMIGEGANDVLRAFIALVGMRDVGLELERASQVVTQPFRRMGGFLSFTGRKLGDAFVAPQISTQFTEIEPEAQRLGRDIRKFGWLVVRLLAKYQRDIVDRQYQLGRVADIAIELYVSACVLRRLEYLSMHEHDEISLRQQLAAARYYLTTAHRRMAQAMRDTRDNVDELTTRLADQMLK